MWDVIMCDSTENERGEGLQLCLEILDGDLMLTAENHDHYTWESQLYDPVVVIKRIFESSGRAERERIMAIDFSAFDNKVNLDELQKDVDAAGSGDFDEVPDGTYIVTIEKMEIKTTKAGDKLMFSVQCKITSEEEGQKGRMIFFNRPISGNKQTDKWGDGKAIKSVITWLDKLGSEIVPEFVNYGDFSECVLDIFQEIQGRIELEVEYKAEGFNSISIKEVFDI